MPVTKIKILSIFPGIFSSFLNESLIKKAIDSRKVEITTLDIRDFATLPHKKVDDEIYGGGVGMLLKPEPLIAAIEFAKKELPDAKTILLSPSGNKFTQTLAKEFSQLKSLILVCGRYEGVDQRVIDLMIDQEISIGDYILMGGEVPAMVIIEASLRHCHNILGNPESIKQESFSLESSKPGYLEPPQYTRPPSFRGLEVPEVLISGNHKAIADWQEKEILKKTEKQRPDLILHKK